MTSFALVVLGLALLAAVFALGREMRLRKALEKLLRILLSRWRTHVSKTQSQDVDPVRSSLPLAVTHGCDDRATQIAREAADRQAQQNTAMAELNKEVASGTHQLVEADAQARKEIVGVHHDLQAERTRLDSGWNELEGERRQIAGQRRTESMLVPVTTLVGGGLLVVVLLGFCWYALVAVRTRR